MVKPTLFSNFLWDGCEFETMNLMIKQTTSKSKSSPMLLGDENSFRLLVESIKDYAIIMLDPDGHVVTWNAGAENFKGYRAEEIIGKDFSCFYPPEAVQRGLPEQELKAAAKDGRFEDEGWRVRKDGKRFWANVIISALRDKDGKLQGYAMASGPVRGLVVITVRRSSRSAACCGRG